MVGLFAIDGDRQGRADLSHAISAQAAEPFDQKADRHALHRVEVDRARTWHWVLVRLEHDFAMGQTVAVSVQAGDLSADGNPMAAPVTQRPARWAGRIPSVWIRAAWTMTAGGPPHSPRETRYTPMPPVRPLLTR